MHSKDHLRCKPILASRVYVLLLALSVSLAAAQSSESSSQPILKITGNVPTPLTLTLEDLKKLPHQEVTFKEHEGSTAVYQGVPLLTLLTKAGAPVGSQLKGKAFASYVLASARDGYQVTFTLAELDPAIRDSTVLVADQRDGRALGEQLGPIRIIAVTDKKAARSIRMLTSLEVILLRP